MKSRIQLRTRNLVFTAMSIKKASGVPARFFVFSRGPRCVPCLLPAATHGLQQDGPDLTATLYPLDEKIRRRRSLRRRRHCRFPLVETGGKAPGTVRSRIIPSRRLLPTSSVAQSPLGEILSGRWSILYLACLPLYELKPLQETLRYTKCPRLSLRRTRHS